MTRGPVFLLRHPQPLGHYVCRHGEPDHPRLDANVRSNDRRDVPFVRHLGDFLFANVSLRRSRRLQSLTVKLVICTFGGQLQTSCRRGVPSLPFSYDDDALYVKLLVRLRITGR